MFELILNIIIVIIVIAIFYIPVFGLLSVIMIKKPSFNSLIDQKAWITSIIVSPIIMVEALLAMYLISEENFNQWYFASLSTIDLVNIIIIGSIAIVMIILFNYAIKFNLEGIVNKPREKRDVLLFTFLIVILASIAEELFFRGFLLTLIDKINFISYNFGEIQITQGCILSALSFGLVHMSLTGLSSKQKAVLFFEAVILGLLAGILFLHTKNIFSAIIIHMLFNLAELIAANILTRKNTESKKISS